MCFWRTQRKILIKQTNTKQDENTSYSDNHRPQKHITNNKNKKTIKKKEEKNTQTK